jgi:hypothetical protein
MFKKIQFFWTNNPLLAIMLLALLIRLVSVVFSKGYGMHDDQFIAVEFPQQVVNDFSEWEKMSSPLPIIYPGIQYVTFYSLEHIGIKDPQTKMLFVRLIHALYSLLIVFFGYKITLKLAGEKNAGIVGLILALLWILPFMSVRNLVEVVCIPPLMAGFYIAVLDDRRWFHYVLIGCLFAISFSMRIQTALFVAGYAFALLIQAVTKKDSKLIPGVLMLSAGFVFTSFLLLGIPDWLKWGEPFAQLIGYVKYNASHGYDYIVGPWYNYILVILGVLIPPVSFLLIFGFIRTWKKHYIIFIPAILFFVFHSYFPNKQERFILPDLPFIVILGVIGWQSFADNSKFWLKHKNLLKGFWIWFWIINSVLLIIFSTTYSKKTRVETMSYLYKKNVTGVFVLCGRFGHVKMPEFYLNYKSPIYTLLENYNADSLNSVINNQKLPYPNYAIFYDDFKLKERLGKFEKDFDVLLKYDNQMKPSFLDYLLFKLNPTGNKNQTAYIYYVKKKTL